MSSPYGTDPMEATEAQVEEHFNSQTLAPDQERRIADIEAEYQSELKHWGTSALDYLARTAFRFDCDDRIRAIEEEE